jgi:capsular polysaccharide biosynthesis protein
LGIDLSWISIQDISNSEIKQHIDLKHSTPIASIKNVLLHAPSGHIFLLEPQLSKRPILLKESSYWEPIHAQYSHGLIPKKNITSFIQSEIVGSIPQSTNYYHWILDELPEIMKLNETIEKIDFVHSGKLAQYQEAGLNLLSIKSKEVDPWVLIPSIAISQSRKLTGEIDVINLNHLENLARPYERKDRYSKVYISRRYSSRSIKNENLFEELLKTLGFEILYLERTDFLKQIEIFRSARVVLGAHGAGLANLVFCKSETQIIEIFNHNCYNPCFKRIAEAKGLKYHQIEYLRIESLFGDKEMPQAQDLLRILSSIK